MTDKLDEWRMCHVMKKISIIVPIYNVEKYLQACLDSIVSQCDDSCEIICVEDASTDKSKVILEDFKHEHPEIIVLFHDRNRGLSAARNTGIEAAAGQYIMFVDSDDMLASDAIETLLKYVSNDDIELFYYNMRDIYEEDYLQNKKRIVRKKYNDIEGVYTGIELFCKLYEHKIIKVESWRCLYLRKFLLEHHLRFYEGMVHEDNLFYFQCMTKAKRAVDINKELYMYRHRGGSITDYSDPIRTKKSIESQWLAIYEVLKEWNPVSFTLAQNHMLQEYIFRAMHQLLRKMDVYGDNIKTSILPDHLSKILFLFLQNRNHFWGKLTPRMLEDIRKYKKVYLYGAGGVAEDIFYQLLRNDIVVDEVIVTKLENNKAYFKGIKIQVCDMIEPIGDEIVILCAGKAIRNEMRKKMMEKGFDKFIEPEDGICV